MDIQGGIIRVEGIFFLQGAHPQSFNKTKTLNQDDQGFKCKGKKRGGQRATLPSAPLKLVRMQALGA